MLLVIEFRMTLGYFCVGGLDILGHFESEGSTDDVRVQEEKQRTKDAWIEWVWELQARQYVQGHLAWIRS